MCRIKNNYKSKLYDISVFNKKIVFGLVLSTISIVGLGILIFYVNLLNYV